jgi:hypothetical protein
MQDLHDWICKQLNSCLIFDLIVAGKLVVDLSVTFEMLVKKYATFSEDSLKVVYRVRGIVGEAAELHIPTIPD